VFVNPNDEAKRAEVTKAVARTFKEEFALTLDPLTFSVVTAVCLFLCTKDKMSLNYHFELRKFILSFHFFGNLLALFDLFIFIFFARFLMVFHSLWLQPMPGIPRDSQYSNDNVRRVALLHMYYSGSNSSNVPSNLPKSVNRLPPGHAVSPFSDFST
jgi:hypothetical protein